MTAPSILSTGNSVLDYVLGGGVPRSAVVVIAGEPGTGKTILASQMLFECARRGERCHYFSTLSEPAVKLLQHLQRFAFYDAGLVGSQFHFSDLGSTLRSEGAAAAIQQVIEHVEAHQPTLIAIDSFKALYDLTSDLGAVRTLVYDLAATLASWSATSFLIGEFVREDVPHRPEFGIADGILLLTQEQEELTAVRHLEILKVRGQSYVSGRHAYEITARGLGFYPRLAAESQQVQAPLSGRASIGVPSLDELLHGGLPRGSSTLIYGGAGIGKTLLALHFVQAGLEAGEPAVFISTEEKAPELRHRAEGLGWSLGAAEAAGKLELLHVSPLDLLPERFLVQAVEAAQRLGAQRLVIDGLSGLALGISNERRCRQLTYALAKRLREEKVTLVMTQEIPELLGASALSSSGVSSMADNIVLLRYAEVEAALRRALAVLKMRGSAHDARLWQFTIGPQGFELEGVFTAYYGVLTGIPTPAGPRSRPDEP
jgi:circadian clock protein KaiC